MRSNPAISSRRPALRSRARSRLWVHLALIGTATVSLVFEPVLTLHMAVGLLFVGLVVVHLVQRRRVSTSLARGLARRSSLRLPSSRLAVADALLLGVTAAMLASGLWDWLGGHPTRIRWHAISGVVLAAYLVAHTLRRRRRLARSNVR